MDGKDMITRNAEEASFVWSTAMDSTPEQTRNETPITESELRELRRRRILERGADRLAFITGEKGVLDAAVEPTEGLSVLGSEEAGSSGLDPPLGGFTVGLPPQKTTRTRKLKSSLIKTTASSSDRSSPAQGVEFEEFVSASFSSANPNNVNQSPVAFNPFESLASATESKTVTLTSAINKTKSIRLIFTICLGLLISASLLIQQCKFPDFEAISLYTPSWPFGAILTSDCAIIFGLFSANRLWKGNWSFKPSPSIPGSEGGAFDLFQLISRLQKAFSVVVVVKNLFAALVVDCSVMLVLVCCALSIGQWYFPECR